MDVRRLLTAVGAGLLGVAVTAVGTPTAASAATAAAPKSFSVARAADDVRKINVTWKPVAGIDHYVVDTVAGAVQTVVNVPSSTLSYTVDAPDECTSYKVRVGGADETGATVSTGYWTIKSLTPSYVSAMRPGREADGTVITATWNTPSWTGFSPLTGYHVVLTRSSDGVVLSDTTNMNTSFRYEGADPARSYSLQVTPENAYGACALAKSSIDRYRPADPSDLVVQRRADAPGTVEVVWKAATSGPAPTYYQIGYGESKVTKLTTVPAPATSTTLSLDTAKTWTVEVKAYNANGGSGAITGSVPVWEAPVVTPAPSTPATPAPAASTPAPAPSTPAAGTGTGTAPATPAAEPSPEPTTEPTTTSTTVSTGSDRIPPTISTTLSATPKSGYFRSAVTIHFTCADNSGSVASCPADITAANDGMTQRFTGTAVDPAGNTTTLALSLNVDKTAPLISSTVKGTKNANGWYAAAPTVHYTCSDAVSGIATLAGCPVDTTITVDGVDQRVTGTATDKAGNTATDTVLLNIDQVAPVVKATVVGDANADGWFTTPPTVRFTCTDAVSGIATCPADRKVTTDGLGQTITGTAVDKAGNTATAALTLNVDQAAPAITATVLGEANENGWYAAAPTVHFTCTDAGAGVGTCPADVTVDGEGAELPVVGTATDKAGNTATTAVTVNVDRTAPAITATVVGEANADGWYKSAPTVRFTCTDTGSGIATCPEDTEVTTDGAAQVVTGTATDKAGNTTATSVTVNVDRTAPEITATVAGEPNGDGWYNSAPTVHFTCTDEGSGIVECPADTTVTDGTGKIVMGTVADRAGNTSTTSVTVNVDGAAPAITATLVDAPNADGWFNSAPTVRFTCTDEGSGLADCPADATVTANGADQVVSGTATDKAGNTATASVTVNVDLDSPELTAAVDGVKNAAGWYRSAPAVRYTCADTGSGVATCPADTTVAGEGVAVSVPATAADKAGNTTTSTVTVNVDKTAPVVTVVGPANGAKYGADSVPAVSCRTTDALSGVATEAKATDTTTQNGVHTVVCAGGVDKAGNPAASVSLTYTVEATMTWLQALTHKYLDGKANAATLKDFDTTITKKNWGQFIAKVVVQSVGRNPALNPTQSATLIWYAMTMNCR